MTLVGYLLLTADWGGVGVGGGLVWFHMGQDWQAGPQVNGLVISLSQNNINFDIYFLCPTIKTLLPLRFLDLQPHLSAEFWRFLAKVEHVKMPRTHVLTLQYIKKFFNSQRWISLNLLLRNVSNHLRPWGSTCLVYNVKYAQFSAVHPHLNVLVMHIWGRHELILMFGLHRTKTRPTRQL